MQKASAVESLGQRELLLPARITAALRANDRLKVYLTVLQAASSHASHLARAAPDLALEMATAGLNEAWLRDAAAAARWVDDGLVFPDLARLLTGFSDDLASMARPVLETTASDAPLHVRAQHWLAWLAGVAPDRLSEKQIEALTHGHRRGPDSLHLLVMDLHKQINRLAGELASELIDGAATKSRRGGEPISSVRRL